MVRARVLLPAVLFRLEPSRSATVPILGTSPTVHVRAPLQPRSGPIFAELGCLDEH